jgi:hypothetical protein
MKQVHSLKEIIFAKMEVLQVGHNKFLKSNYSNKIKKRRKKPVHKKGILIRYKI